MKRIVAIFTVLILVLNGCKKTGEAPSGQLTPTFFPTLTGYFQMTTSDEGTIDFNEVGFVPEGLDVSANTLQVHISNSSFTKLQQEAHAQDIPNEEPIDLNEKSTLEFSIDYKDRNNKLWSSPIVTIVNNRSDNKSSNSQSSNQSLIGSGAPFSVTLYNNNGDSIVLNNCNLQVHANNSKILKSNTIQFK